MNTANIVWLAKAYPGYYAELAEARTWEITTDHTWEGRFRQDVGKIRNPWEKPYISSQTVLLPEALYSFRICLGMVN